jgi:hypothetical protein
MVGLNRRRGMGAVAPANAQRGRVPRPEVPCVDRLQNLAFHAGSVSHGTQTACGVDHVLTRRVSDAARIGTLVATTGLA